MPIKIDEIIKSIDKVKSVNIEGRLTSLVGLSLRANVPGVKIGETVKIMRSNDFPLEAEVVGFEGEEVILVPLGELNGLAPGAVVKPTEKPFAIQCGLKLLGRVIDGLGNPIDGKPFPHDLETWSVFRNPPSPLLRKPITSPLTVGVKALDGLTTIGIGQRVGLFAGSGVGKSTLLGQIARGTDAEIVVLCLIGERGREVREFLEDSLGEEGLEKSVIVVATSDTPAMIRSKSAYVATAIAEYFRDLGKNVLLMMDSLTRFARAMREIGLEAGEPPVRRGYTPSVFAALPKLLERAGNSDKGSITGIYTVLVEGGDMEEPIADEVRGILDGHIILSREIAHQGQWPAIDILSSLSRVMDKLINQNHHTAAARLRTLLSSYEKQRDLIMLGAYKKGSDPGVDEAIYFYPHILKFLTQDKNTISTFEDTLHQLIKTVTTRQ